MQTSLGSALLSIIARSNNKEFLQREEEAKQGCKSKDESCARALPAQTRGRASEKVTFIGMSGVMSGLGWRGNWCQRSTPVRDVS